jgi:hypothetical protein
VVKYLLCPEFKPQYETHTHTHTHTNNKNNISKDKPGQSHQEELLQVFTFSCPKQNAKYKELLKKLHLNSLKKRI